MVSKQSAIVFHGGGRRWFTLKSACRAEARAMIRKRCDCERPEYGERGDMIYGGQSCKYHHNDGIYGQEVISRLARRIARSYRATPKDQP